MIITYGVGAGMQADCIVRQLRVVLGDFNTVLL